MKQSEEGGKLGREGRLMEEAGESMLNRSGRCGLIDQSAFISPALPSHPFCASQPLWIITRTPIKRAWPLGFLV